MEVPPDGLVAVVKRDCPTCRLVAPLLHEIAGRGATLPGKAAKPVGRGYHDVAR